MVIDPLTGVYSRNTLEQRLHEEIERARRYETPFSIILLDLDHYKSVNDAFGHLRGDRVLADFAKRVSELIRKADIIFRYGGDEFLLLLPNTDKTQAVYLAQRLLDAVRAQPFHGKPPLTLSISLGVASFPDDAHDPEALFEKADQRHYEAKRRGRGRVVGVDPEKPPLLSFDEDSRLVERDDALAVLHRFLSQMPEKSRGALAITGPTGVGRHRFLSEVGKVARLQGYEVISFQGSQAYKSRAYGGLTEACSAWEILPPPASGEELFAQALQQLVLAKGRTGILFAVDKLAEVDWPTLELLRYLLFQAAHPQLIALAFTADRGTVRNTLPQSPPLMEMVELGPLSREGFHISLRMNLKWEAPASLNDWLYEQTGGLPSYMQKALSSLVQLGVLEPNEGGWKINRDLATYSIKEHLAIPEAITPYHLPAAPTYFVGRWQEIEDARRLLATARLVTIIGPGGVGKTRLALQVANQVLEEYKDSVWWVPLAAVNSPEFIPSAIADALKFTFYGREDTETQLFNYLREKEMLLVMDNLEHLVNGAGLLSQLLENASRVKILATSRVRLNLRGEAVLELEGMSYPTQKDGEGIEEYTAVQLFVQNARHSDPSFYLDERSRLAVARICEMVEGLPLGIELASAWVRVLSCEEIAGEIEHNLDFLTSEMQDRPGRHRSLRAVFEHSWTLLLPEEQRVLARISVFEGGFRRDAAVQVAGAALAHLSMLMDKSLLRRAATGRYEMHEVLHQYAGGKLAAFADEAEPTRQRHSAFYANYVKDKKLLLKGERQKEALEAIGEEIENIRVGWSWASDHFLTELLEQYLDGLYTFYDIKGLFHEGLQIVGQASDWLEARTRTSSLASETECRLFGKIISRLAAYNLHMARNAQARPQFEEAIQIFRGLDEKGELAFSLYKQAVLLDETGEYDQAIRSCEESLALYRNNQDANGIGRVLIELGAIAYQQGQYSKAKNFHQEARAIFQKVNDRWGMASSLINLGNVEVELGEYAEARRIYEESLAIFQEADDLTGIAAVYNNLGDISQELKDYSAARDYLTRSLSTYTKIGDRYGMAIATGNLGDVAYHLGNNLEAYRLFQQCIDICEETGNRLQAAYAMAHMGYALCALGRYPQARKCFQDTLQISIHTQVMPLVLDSIIGIARLHKELGDGYKAMSLLSFALHHPALMKVQKDEGETLLARLNADMDEESARTAAKVGLQLSIDEVVQEILHDTLANA